MTAQKYENEGTKICMDEDIKYKRMRIQKCTKMRT